MKVLHIVASGERRGAEIFASDLIRSLNDGSYRHSVVVIDAGRNSVAYDAPTQVLSRRWQAPGLRMDFHRIRALRETIDRTKPDVVHAHGGATLKYSVVAMASRPEPLIFRSIGLAPPWIRSGIRRAVFSRLVRRAARTVATGQSVREQIIRTFGLPPERVAAIPNGVDPQRLRATHRRERTLADLGIPPHHKVILSVGALTWEKDPHSHLAVTEEILTLRPDVSHVLIGDGPLRPHVERQILNRRLDGRVRVLGSRVDVPELLHAGDVLLLASRIEGMPACVIEAGMVGVPAAAYAIAGVPEIVEHGSTGLLTVAGERSALTRAVFHLLDDDGERQRMGMAARERYTRRFHIREVAARYAALFEEVAS